MMLFLRLILGERGVRRTVVSWKTVLGGVEELGENLSCALGAQTRAVSVVVHEWHLVRGLICRLKVRLLNVIGSTLDGNADVRMR